uniref:Uncharacterized protein n=1 Tax=Anguilla anguilla TaxID=7936 RepID=A0A0E9SZF9_ANGAN
MNETKLCCLQYNRKNEYLFWVIKPHYGNSANT